MFYAVQAASASNWMESASKLTEDRNLRLEGIRELRQVPDLEEKIRHAFGRPPEDLALAVIRSLELKEFFPRVIGLIERSNGTKLNWNAVVTANTLASMEDRKRLIALYKTKMMEKNIPSPALLALLAGLEKLDHRLLPAELGNLLSHPSFEVRIASTQAASNYLRHDFSYGPLLVTALSAKPYQVRLIAHQGLL